MIGGFDDFDDSEDLIDRGSRSLHTLSRTFLYLKDA
jgi:hypothetical protein